MGAGLSERQVGSRSNKYSSGEWQVPPRQPLPQRRSPGNIRQDRFAPRRGEQNASSSGRNWADSVGNSRYQVNLDSRGPPVPDSSTFGAGQLRRRTETLDDFDSIPQSTERASPRTPGPGKLDQGELDALLGNAPGTNRGGPQRQYAPASFNANARAQCMHCGRKDHLSSQCPTKPVLRQEPKHEEAVNNFFRNRKFDDDTPHHPASATEDRRQLPVESERRRARFLMDDRAPQESSNRLDQPLRRRNTNYKEKTRRVGSRFNEDEEDQDEDRAELKRQRKAEKKKRMQEEAALAPPTPVTIPQFISVANLASLLRVRAEEFVTKLEDLGFEEVQMDHILNAEHAGLIAQEYNFEPVVQTEAMDLIAAPPVSAEEYATLPARPPVVTIMGHVDHGKTTILDYMRSTSVAASEFGGITQHIGAFSVPLASGKNITFLDTPGHSAFETMRARGANVTDIVVLVVAADDSVMPQTVEAIKHAHSAKVPIIVAINKIDLPAADIESVKLDLGRHGLEVEDYGGDIQAIPVSGVTGQGLSDLEEAIVTLSEMLDHRADPHASVEGWILEGSTKKSGKVATVLVRRGTLRVGDILVAGTTWARVRTLKNEGGIAIDEVGPGMPVEVDGWREQPIAGDEVLQAADEHQGQEVAETRFERLERTQMAKDMDAINEFRRAETERREAEKAAAAAAAAADAQDAATTAAADAAAKKSAGPDIVHFIVKGDVSGSVEAVLDSISPIGNADIGTRVLRHGVGSPSEFDVQHAADAKGHIINFNTSVPPHISQLAELKGVRIFDDNIIYRVVDNVKRLLEDRLPPRITHRVTGEVDIALVFEIGLGGKRKLKVAGCKVRNGLVVKGGKAKVVRKDKVVYEGAYFFSFPLFPFVVCAL